MATRKTSSKKHTPKMSRTTPTKHALIMRKFERDEIKRSGLDFAGLAKMNRLLAQFLRANGYSYHAKRYFNSAQCDDIMARSTRETVPRGMK
jgi:hypothetical protein